MTSLLDLRQTTTLQHRRSLCLLRDCAEELTDSFTDIFNTLLSRTVVPTCLKTTTIIPVQKDVAHQIHPPPALDPYQFDHLRYLHYRPLSPQTLPGDQKPTRQNAVHQLQLNIQHSPPPAAHPQTDPAGTQSLPAGLSDRKTTGGSGRPPLLHSAKRRTAHLHPAPIFSPRLRLWDLRSEHAQHPPLTINGAVVERVSSSRLCTSPKTCRGTSTPHHWLRKLNSNSTSSGK